jgi:hypothetical protein
MVESLPYQEIISAQFTTIPKKSHEFAQDAKADGRRIWLYDSCIGISSMASCPKVSTMTYFCWPKAHSGQLK